MRRTLSTISMRRLGPVLIVSIFCSMPIEALQVCKVDGGMHEPMLSVAPREDLVGEALKILYDQHGFKREDFFLQTKSE